jgi:hypothetical protein
VDTIQTPVFIGVLLCGRSSVVERLLPQLSLVMIETTAKRQHLLGSIIDNDMLSNLNNAGT